MSTHLSAFSIRAPLPRSGESEKTSRGGFALRAGVWLALLIIAITLAGCGKKGPPQAPPGEPYTYPRTYPGA